MAPAGGFPAGFWGCWKSQEAWRHTLQPHMETHTEWRRCLLVSWHHQLLTAAGTLLPAPQKTSNFLCSSSDKAWRCLKKVVRNQWGTGFCLKLLKASICKGARAEGAQKGLCSLVASLLGRGWTVIELAGPGERGGEQILLSQEEPTSLESALFP